MKDKTNNWQDLLSKADEELADLPEVLKTLKETWKNFAPMYPPFKPTATVIPINTGHWFFFFN